MWFTYLNAKENQRTTCKNVSKQNEIQNSPAFYNNEIASFPFHSTINAIINMLLGMTKMIP